MDYKFWALFVVSVLGVGGTWWQIRIMKQSIPELPSPRSLKRNDAERRLARRLYTPVIIMAVLVISAWVPYFMNSSSDVLHTFVHDWGSSPVACSANVDTAQFYAARNKYRLVMICSISDSTVDILEEPRIAASKPFNITGGMVFITAPYDPQSAIGKAAQGPNILTGQTYVLLPKDQDASRIRKISDVTRDGGIILVPGMKIDF